MLKTIIFTSRRGAECRAATFAFAGCLALAGCSGGPGAPMFARTGVGTLKTRVAQLERQSEQQKTQLAESEAENRRLSDRLAREEALNGDLTARLDDARAAFSQRGLDSEGILGSAQPSPGYRSRTEPATRGRAVTRKPPFAQIGGPVEPLDDGRSAPLDDEFPASPDWGSRGGADDRQSYRSRQLDRDSLWLPIAGGVSAPSTTRK